MLEMLTGGSGGFTGGASGPATATGTNNIDAGNVHIGGLTLGKTKGIDLRDPLTAVLVGGGVLLFGAVLLKAVK